MEKELSFVTALFPEKKEMTCRCRKTDEFSCLHGLIFDFFDQDRVHDSTVLLILDNEPQDIRKTLRTAVLILMQRALTDDGLSRGSQHIITGKCGSLPQIMPELHVISL